MTEEEARGASAREGASKPDRECGYSEEFKAVCTAEETTADAISYCTLFEENPMILFIVDEEGIVQSVNTFGASQLGYTPAELTGKPILNIFHEEDREEVLLRLNESVRNPERITFWEFRKVCKNGTIRWVKEFARPLRGNKGQLRVLIACEDITERKSAEEALLQSKEKYRELVELANSSILKIDAQGNIIFFNEFAQRFFGYAEQEVLGRSVMETITPACGEPDKGVSPLIMDDILRDPDSSVAKERECTRKDGGRVWVAWTHRVIRDEEGRFVEILLVGHDVTEHRKAEEALAQSEELLRTVLEILPVGVWIIDSGGQIVKGNSAGQQIWKGALYVGPDGYGEYKGWWADTGKRIEAGEWSGGRAVTKGETSLNEVIDIECFDGTRKTIINSAVPIRDDRGTIRGAVVVNQDITGLTRAEAELRESERRFQAFMNNSPALAFITNRDLKLLYANKTYLEAIGLQPEDVGTKSAYDIFPPEFAGRYRENIMRVLDTGQTSQTVETYPRPDGALGYALVYRFTMEGMREREMVGVVAVDITERVRAEEALKNANERLKSVLESITDAYLVLDDQWRFIEMNSIAEKILRRPAHELLGKVVWQEYPECVGSEFYRQYLLAVEKRQPVHFEANYPVSDRWYEVHAYPREGRLEAYLRNITERKRMEETIRRQATQDPLTGLFNRTMFMDHLLLEMAQARRDGKKVAVLFLDLDRFKYINDTLGHDAGDQLLKEVACRLKGSMRESDTIARIGGDEFNVLLPSISQAEDVIAMARKIIFSFKEPYSIAGHRLSMSTSIGISIYPDDGEDAETLLKNADIAMYHAKEQGGNNYQFYDLTMNVRTLERIMLESSLHQALERGELTVYYQPQVDMETWRMVGAEALVRWQHPELGMLDPLRFISLAEETGYILSIDEWVLRKACAQCKAWQDAGLPSLRITVNLSARQFQQPDFVGKVSRIIEETGLNPRFLDLEITESIAMKNVDLTVFTLRRLKEMGVLFSIDDFGTGYSSLSYLKRLPINRIKIDQSFIRGLTEDPDDRGIVNAVIAMAHTMKKKVIAEGVETEGQLQYLHIRHCDEIQGHLVSRPLPADDFENRIRTYTIPSDSLPSLDEE